MEIKDSTIENVAWVTGDRTSYRFNSYGAIEDCQYLAACLISRGIDFRFRGGDIEFKAPDVVVNNMKKRDERLAKIDLFER